MRGQAEVQRGAGFTSCEQSNHPNISTLRFQEDLSEAVVQGDALPGHVGSACLLSSTIAELGKSCGTITLPIMNRISRKTIGKVRGMLNAEMTLA